MEAISFTPLYMTRIWGGRTLEERYSRPLPDDQPYGESWEISDREDEQSIVAQGPFAGKSLHDLWTGHREEIFGQGLEGERFPLLIKILDARTDLSIQVHPPIEKAASLGGDPKTEMWYIADCDPDAQLYVGLKNDVTRGDFEQALQDGTVADKVHAIPTKPDESIFIPSGRLHAIGAGFLIYEIQQNSDTTYRVFDWNRVGLDGNPRELHVEKSLASIDFDDFEPQMDTPDGDTLAACEYFQVDRQALAGGDQLAAGKDRFAIITVIKGTLVTGDGRTFQAGDFFLLPRKATVHSPGATSALITTIPSS